MKNEPSWYSIDRITTAYSNWIMGHLKQGWKPFLITLQFKPLPGGRRSILIQMHREIDRFYSILVNRLLHHPRSPSQACYCPRLILVPDLPTARWQKKSLPEVSINDGMHFHALLLIPPKSRLKTNPVSHFKENESIYVTNRLLKFDAALIHSNLPSVVEYVFKSIKRRKFSIDDIVIYPKSTKELD